MNSLKSIAIKYFTPAALALGTTPAAAQSSDTAALFGHLNFLLNIQITQYAFYQACLSAVSPANVSPNLNAAYLALPAGKGIQQGIAIIAQDKLNHIKLITSLFPSTIPVVKSSSYTFDFTLSANIPDISTNYVNLLLLAQILEDTGVRCYKGLLQKFTASSARTTYLPQLLAIHSVLARHAAYIRQARRNIGQPVTPWVFGNGLQAAGLSSQSTQSALVNNVYLSEDNSNQAQISLTGINGHSEISATVASSAFDEVLTQAQCTLILKSIIITGLI